MYFTGIKMNQLLERLVLPLKDTDNLFVKNSPVATFDFIKYLAEVINCLGNSHLSDSKIAGLIMELYDEKMNGIFKKGNLVKKGGRRKNWKKRWFVLKNGALIYYESKESVVMKVCLMTCQIYLHIKILSVHLLYVCTCIYVMQQKIKVCLLYCF